MKRETTKHSSNTFIYYSLVGISYVLFVVDYKRLWVEPLLTISYAAVMLLTISYATNHSLALIKGIYIHNYILTNILFLMLIRYESLVLWSDIRSFRGWSFKTIILACSSTVWRHVYSSAVQVLAKKMIWTEVQVFLSFNYLHFTYVSQLLYRCDHLIGI